MLPPFPADVVHELRALRPNRPEPGVVRVAPVGTNLAVDAILKLEHELQPAPQHDVVYNIHIVYPNICSEHFMC